MNAAKYIRYILTIATALLFFSACKDDKNESQPTDFILRVNESVSIKLPNSTSYTITTNNSAISYELSGKILTVTAIKEGKVTLTVILDSGESHNYSFTISANSYQMGFTIDSTPGFSADFPYLRQLKPDKTTEQMKRLYRSGAALLVLLAVQTAATAQETRQTPGGTTYAASDERSGNPLFEGWYADPEGVVFGDEYWIFPTWSAPYDEQTFLDAFSSKDLVRWTKHPRIVSTEEVRWIRRAMWAPAAIHANGKYYLFFSGNDIQNNDETGGIGVAVADRPEGPYRDALGRPLIDRIVHGAQPIDQFVFRDDDGEYYMYYGGWGHCNMVRLAPDLLSVIPFEDGETFKEITPENYVEGPFMLKRQGKYYFMWSEGLR